MNRRLRVLLIGRNFWPHGTIDSAGFLFQLACGLHRQGVHVEVASPRHSSAWPSELTVREILVHRPVAAPRSDWTMGRYIRQLTTWLRQAGRAYDLLLVDSIREESMAAIEAARSLGCPTIVRCSHWGEQSDPMWWRTSRSARRCGAIGKMADAVIAPSAASQRLLLADGYVAQRVERINNGFPTGPVRSLKTQRAARAALGAVNADLTARDDTKVVMCASRMTIDGGVQLLVKAASKLISQHRDLRLWFIGEGPARDRIYEHLRGEGIRASIAMPGSFCSMEELFVAADIFVQLDDDGLEYLLPSAIGNEMPVVSVDNESTRAVISGGGEAAAAGEPDPCSLVRWCSMATSQQLRGELLEMLDDLPGHRDKASQLRRISLRGRPQSETIQAYIDLMERLVRNKPGTRRQSVEAIS